MGKGRQYLANFFGPKRDSGDPIALIYLAIQVTSAKKLEEDQGVDKIFAAARAVPAQLGIDPAQYIPPNNFQKLARYEGEPALGKAIEKGNGLGVMQRVPCGAKGLATPILDEVQEMPTEDEVIIIARVKCVAHAAAVQGSQQVAPPGMLGCSTVVAMDVAGRPLLLETMGARPAGAA